MQLSVIVPTYNERARLRELVHAIAAVGREAGIQIEIVIVDDNSPDGTGQEADRLATEYDVVVVHRPGKLGLGSAVIAGFEAARGDVFGVMDGDFSHPPALLPRMFKAAADADFVIASRYIDGGTTEGWPLGRALMSRGACLLARPLTPVRDATSGFFLVKREVVRDVRIAAGGFKICLELLVRGRARTVVELPYRFTNRQTGKSKMNLREALGYLTQLRSLAWYRLSHRTTAARPRYARLPPDW